MIFYHYNYRYQYRHIKHEEREEKLGKQSVPFTIRSSNFGNANTISFVMPVPLFPKKHVSCGLKKECSLAGAV